MKITFIFLLILIPSFTFSQTTSSKLKSLIPKNWEVLTYAEGSLNADNLNDLAIIIQPKNTNIKNRKLLIFFLNKTKAIKKYYLKKFLNGHIQIKKHV